MSRLLKILFIFLACLFFTRLAYAACLDPDCTQDSDCGTNEYCDPSGGCAVCKPKSTTPNNPPNSNTGSSTSNTGSSASHSTLSLPDYLETDVFPKLAPEEYQDRCKNAMILRTDPSPDPSALEALYGFKPATNHIHDYAIPKSSLTLSKLTPKPSPDPNNPQALIDWENSPTAKVWPNVPMFTREDTKGFIEAAKIPPGQVTRPPYTEVIHPHLARTYEVSSALQMLMPYQTPASVPDSGPPPPNPFITATGDLARDSYFISNSATAQTTPLLFITYTPFLKEINYNLLGDNGIFNLFAINRAFPADIPGLGPNPNPNGKFYFSFLGSILCAQQRFEAFLQPFTGKTITLDPACSKLNNTNNTNNGGNNASADCDQSIPDQIPTNGTMDKNTLAQNAPAGNRVLECYNEVVKRSKDKGISPAFTLLIWLNESGCSSNSRNRDFGSLAGNNFSEKLDNFLNKPTDYITQNPGCFINKDTTDSFFGIFKVGSCNPGDGQPYIDLFNKRWSWITKCPNSDWHYPFQSSCF